MGVEPDLYQLFHSSQTGPFQLNFVGFRSPEADRLIAGIRQEYDPARKVALCRALHRVIAREQPYTFLFAPRWTAALDPGIAVREADAGGRARYRPVTPAKTGTYTFDFNRWVRLSRSPRLSPAE
jgi:ABC-type transport system substrate-binding protein